MLPRCVLPGEIDHGMDHPLGREPGCRGLFFSQLGTPRGPGCRSWEELGGPPVPKDRRAPVGKAFTLIELMIVLVLIGLLISMTLPSSTPVVHEQLQAVGQIISTDLAYARSLAIAHGSTYRVRFELANNRYILQHTGPDSTLNILPQSPWRNPEDPPDQHIVRLAELPQVGNTVRLAGIHPPNSSDPSIGEVEFGPLGGTTTGTELIIWLSAGQGQNQRFLRITVDPITGLASPGPVSGQIP